MKVNAVGGDDTLIASLVPTEIVKLRTAKKIISVEDTELHQLMAPVFTGDSFRVRTCFYPSRCRSFPS